MGCTCSVCRSQDPRNNRWRSSVLIELAEGTYVIDTPQEFRLQVLRANVNTLNGVFYTHTHADHIFGIDDLRVFSRHQKLPIYGDTNTLKHIFRTFNYMFSDRVQGSGVPNLLLHDLEHAPVEIGSLHAACVPVYHGSERISGFRLGPFAYVTDCSRIPRQSIDALKGLEVLILGALRYKKHPTHFSIHEAIEVLEILRPRMAYLTHLCHDIDHAILEAALPKGIAPAYDGLTIDL